MLDPVRRKRPMSLRVNYFSYRRWRLPPRLPWSLWARSSTSGVNLNWPGSSVRNTRGAFHSEIVQRGDAVARAVQNVADAEATLRMALELSQPQADPSVYANDARGLANIYHLDFLELAAADGTLISSAHWRPGSGYRNDWVVKESDWNHQGAFLSRMQLPDNVELGLIAVRAVRVADRNLYVIGGFRFDREFLKRWRCPKECARCFTPASRRHSFRRRSRAGRTGPSAGTFCAADRIVAAWAKYAAAHDSIVREGF